MESTTMDLSKLKAADLKAELKRRENEKEADRTAYKELVEQTVPKAIFKLCTASEIMSNAKTEAFKMFEVALKLKAEVYGIKDKQMSHTFSDDKSEITIGYRITDGWDDTVNAGVAKVEKYISSLAKSPETASLVSIVFRLLKKDAKGNLKGSRVLELLQFAKEANDEELTDGVNIIADSYKPVKSVWFIDAALIGEDGKKTNIPLSMSSVDFSKGYKFNFNTEESDVDNN